MKIEVDQSLCIGCGMCIDMCPKVFEYNGNGLSVAKPVGTIEEDIDSVKDAAEACPVSAINVEE